MVLIERSSSIMAAVEGLVRAARRDGDDDRKDRAYNKVMALVNDLAQQHAGAVDAAAKAVAAWDAWHKAGARFEEPPSPWMDLSDAIRALRALEEQ